jgi:hypothetical protein
MNLYEVTLLLEREIAFAKNTPTRITFQVLVYADDPVVATCKAQGFCAKTLGEKNTAATYVDIHTFAQYLRKSNNYDVNIDGTKISTMALDYRPLA